MRQEMQRARAKMRRHYTNSPRHTINVEFYAYDDAVMKERRQGRKRAKRRPRQLTALRKAA